MAATLASGEALCAAFRAGGHSLDAPCLLKPEQVSARHEQIGQRGDHEQLVAILFQAPIARLGKAEDVFLLFVVIAACVTLLSRCDYSGATRSSSLRRWILPDGPLGSSSTKRNCLGVL